MEKKREIKEIVLGKTYRRTYEIVDYDYSRTNPIYRTIYSYREVCEITNNMICICLDGKYDIEWFTKKEFLNVFEEV